MAIASACDKTRQCVTDTDMFPVYSLTFGVPRLFGPFGGGRSWACCGVRSSIRVMFFCQFCHGPLAGTRLTAATPGQAPILRSARINGWRRRSSHRKRVISSCCPSLVSHVLRSRPIPFHGVFLPVIIPHGALRCRRFRASAVLHRDIPRSPSGGLRGPVIEPQSGGRDLPGAAVRVWRRTIYRSVVRRPRCAPVITCWTAGRESRNSRAMAAGLSPAL